MRDRPTPEQLREYFNYDPDTGVITWKRASGAVRVGKIAGGMMDKGYRNIYFLEKTMKAHIVAFVIFHGRYPAKFIDHINGVKSDNRISNLKEATSSQNSMNTKIHSHNKSGIRGVFFHKQSQKWEASIKINGKQFSLGRFLKKEDAAECREKAAEKLFGEFARK